MPRPLNWPNQIDAPSEALEFYRLLARLQSSEAFNDCHVWSGATNGDIPVIRWQGKIKSLHRISAGYLGLPQTKRLCATKNCINPFHHVPLFVPEDQIIGPNELQREPPNLNVTVNLDDYVELVQMAIDDNTLRKDQRTFDILRPLLHVEDISDIQLNAVLDKIKDQS